MICTMIAINLHFFVTCVQYGGWSTCMKVRGFLNRFLDCSITILKQWEHFCSLRCVRIAIWEDQSICYQRCYYRLDRVQYEIAQSIILILIRLRCDAWGSKLKDSDFAMIVDRLPLLVCLQNKNPQNTYNHWGFIFYFIFWLIQLLTIVL